MRSPDPKPPLDRRGFFKKSLVVILGGVAALVPAAAGLLVAVDPLRRKAAARAAVRVTTLDALPADGLPRRFPVIAAKSDAWNRFQAAPIGAVYLRRTADDRVEALNVVCPHAGCFVEFAAAAGNFRCPCHQSTFALDGSIASPGSPSPRALDRLTVKVGDDGAVWVTFQNFQSGRADQVPVS
jgi:menaquinol-cytochrome c reductase iron-sulfur subunit